MDTTLDSSIILPGAGLEGCHIRNEIFEEGTLLNGYRNGGG
ncbi:hypothetical protein ACFL4K_02410 [Candidatus Neomarinimicrobiota bacterium]